MITLIKGAELYAPAYVGVRDILIVGEKIEGIYEELTLPESLPQVTVINAKGKIAAPGFIDGHVHITGGGGEGGFKTRTPELMLSDAIKGGTTTIVGCLGTDGVCRSLPALLAKARGLTEEGITCYAYTGSYEIPVVTITGSVRSDVMLIDRFIGAGEIALADHRSAQMPFEALVNVIAEARVGGMLAGKGGVTNIHLGEGVRGFKLLMQMFDETEIPITQVLPTHVGRSMEVMKLGFQFAKKGGYIDFTTSRNSAKPDDDTRASHALRLALEEGVDSTHVTFSSDGQGSLPRFDSKGNNIGLDVGSCQSLYGDVKDAVLTQGVKLENALMAITSNPADVLKLGQKGRIAAGKDGDVVLLDKESLEILDVFARGQLMMRDKEVLVKGTFEK